MCTITIVKIIYSEGFGNVLKILRIVLLTSISLPSEVLDVQAFSFSLLHCLLYRHSLLMFKMSCFEPSMNLTFMGSVLTFINLLLNFFSISPMLSLLVAF